jgi:hypothetical protein
MSELTFQVQIQMETQNTSSVIMILYLNFSASNVSVGPFERMSVLMHEIRQTSLQCEQHESAVQWNDWCIRSQKNI